MSLHISFDLETLATVPNAAILSIGAALFNPLNGHIVSSFYVNVASPETQGRVVDPNTVAWWAKQPSAATEALESDQRFLDDALRMLIDWVETSTYDDVTVWGNGASFDIAILNDAFHGRGLKSPWRFWNERCLRTLKNLVPPTVTAIPFEGVAHNAGDDARHQAKLISACLQYLDKEQVNG